MRQTFLNELKEEEKLLVKWLPGKDSNTGMFTKNLDGPAFEQFAQVYGDVDAYAPDPLSQEGIKS